MKMIKFPSIEQFRHAVKTVKDQTAFQGLDEDGNPIMDYSKKLPTLTAYGTVKLHGTNASFCCDAEDFWCQSRENIITPLKDNAGFAGFIEANKDTALKMLEQVIKDNNIRVDDNVVSIYGEWCGGSIQKGVALNQLPKMFVIFGCKVSPKDENKPAYWVDSSKLKSPSYKIYNIQDFEKFELEIDFNEPEKAQNDLIAITDKVEKCCPVGKHFGVEGIGEGVVWEIPLKDSKILFKVKGEKHSAKSKVKTLKPVDMEKLDTVDRCVEAITHNWRFEQGLVEVFGQDYENTLDRKRIGEYLKWISQDTFKEELDVITEHGLEFQDVVKKVQQKAKDYFFASEKV